MQTPQETQRTSHHGSTGEAILTTQLPRVFLNCTNTSPISHDHIYPGAFSIKPDFPLVEGRMVHGSGTRPLWRQCPSFLEVKAHDINSPIPDEMTKPSIQPHKAEGGLQPAIELDSEPRPPPKGSLVQCADYARAILACRPFQLSVFGLILWGTNFAAALFDRRGVIVSPAYSILKEDGIRTFVRIILRMTWEMSDVELGRDPTVVRATEDVFDDSNPLLFPRFIPGTSRDNNISQDRWWTIGRPLWSSHALLGRGTSVWWAVDAKQNPVILKTSWRSPKRRGEREIYDEIVKIFGGAGRLPRGVVKCFDIAGSDVALRSDTDRQGDFCGVLLSVNDIRGGRSGTNVRGRPYGPAGNAILHRVAFRDVGKPLWKFTCPEQLVRVLLVVLEGEYYSAL